ncbi:MAG: Lrp/AsnC family transcriptional regulator [Pseudonocardia sp.]
MPSSPITLDDLDLALLSALREHPRAGALELSRLVRVARGTVGARLRRLEESGVITGYGPEVDLAAAGYPVQAFVTCEIAQGALEQIARDLEAIPGVIEAYATTGTGDVLCRIAAASHADLQETLLLLNHSSAIDRSTSVIALTTVVAHRVLPLLARDRAGGPGRAPAYRRG